MAFVEPGKPRYIFTESAGDITVLIPSRKNWFMILFLGFWLLGWAIGEVTVIGMLTGGLFSVFRNGIPDGAAAGMDAFGGLFMVAWLGGWTVGGAFAIYAWLWQVKGFEKIIISLSGLSIEKIVPLWSRSKQYRINDVSALRISPSQASMWNMSGSMEFWGVAGGQLAFDYGARTVKFGIELDKAEAKHVLKDIQKHFPQITESKL